MSNFSSFGDIKDFLSWCKEQKIHKVSVGDLTAEFHHLAFYKEPVTPTEDPEATKEEEEQNLFWSARE